VTEIKAMTCPNCGSPAPADINKGKIITCVHCETPLVWPDNQSKMILRSGDYLCLSCGMDNDKDRKACKHCGARLVKECPSCKQYYYVGDNYCPEGHKYETALHNHETALKKAKHERLLKEEELRKAQLLEEEKNKRTNKIMSNLVLFIVLLLGASCLFFVLS
jgi:hypothetical protein